MSSSATPPSASSETSELKAEQERPIQERSPLWALALRPLAIAAPTALVLVAYDYGFARFGDAHGAGLSLGDLVSLLGAHGVLMVGLALATLTLGASTYGLWQLITRRYSRRAFSFPTWAVALLASLAAFFPADLVSLELVSGAWIQRQSFAPLLRWGVSATLALLVFAIVWVLLAERWHRGKRATVFIALFATLGLALSAADASVLPGLYPTAHLALYAFSALFTFAALLRLARLKVRPALLSAAASLLVIAAAFVPWWRMDAVREAALSQTSHVARHLLPLLTPPRKDDSLHSLLSSMDVKQGSIFEAPNDPELVRRLTTGRSDLNVVLIVVDTLRADALLDWRKPGGSGKTGDTPFLDQWLPSAFRFRYAYSQASLTRASMPALFRSLEPYEEAETSGEPITLRMAGSGRKPVAIIPQYFLIPVGGGRANAQNLVQGFEAVAFFEKDKQSALPDLVEQTLSQKDERPFFAWIHFYMMHDPGYSDRPLSPKDGSPRERYTLSLQSLDRQMARVIDSVERAGGAGNTVYVLTADHGENLGDNRHTGHGATVFEEENRVPLTIYVPGTKGGVIESTVGNIDILPTVMELVGSAPDRTMRGHSLVPLLAAVDAPWPHSYLVANGGLTQQGVVRGRQKLVYDLKTQLFSRYDLVNDPEETRSLFNNSLADRALIADLFRHNPTLARKQLAQSGNLELVAQRLREVDAKQPGSAVPLLLQLMAMADSVETTAAAEKLFRDAGSDELRLLVIRQLNSAEPELARQLLKEHFQKLNDVDAARFAAGLGQQAQPVFAESEIAARIAGLPNETNAADLDGWLSLTQRWEKPLDRWGPVLLRWLTLERELPPRTLRLLAEGALTLRRSGKTETRRQLSDALLPLLSHKDAEVARAAVRALGQLGDAEVHSPVLRELTARATAPRLRQALLYALARLEGKKATPAIVELGKDPLLTVDAIQTLGNLRDPAALPFLREVRRKHLNSFTRAQAARSIELITKVKSKPAKAGKKPAAKATPKARSKPAAKAPPK